MSHGAGVQEEDWENLLLAPPSLEENPLDRFHGDYYRDDEPVTRGLTLAADWPGMEPPSFDKGYGGMGDYDGGLGCMDKMGGMYNIDYSAPAWGSNVCQEPALNSKVERFQDSDTPPAAPTDSFFQMEATTLQVSCRVPADLGNGLVDFLSTQVVSSITKVTRTKFAIKADVFMKSVMCSMKVRVYQNVGNRGYSIEFQKRSGDAHAFTDMYQQASDYFNTKFDVFAGIPKVRHEAELPAFLPPPSLDDTRLQAPELFQPLVDMAASTNMTNLQVEAASGLAEAAQDKTNAASLCKLEIFDQLCKLLQADTFEVLYQAARLFLTLAELPEADHCFTKGRVLPTMLLKVVAEESGDIARSQLAQAFNLVVGRCASTMGKADVQELLNVTNDALQQMSTHPETSIYRDLNEAKFHLCAH